MTIQGANKEEEEKCSREDFDMERKGEVIDDFEITEEEMI